MKPWRIMATALVIASGCASTGAILPDQAPKVSSAAPSPSSWSTVQSLDEGVAVRVTRKDGERFFGHVMAVSAFDIKLELVDASETLLREDVRLVERFPRSFPRSLPGAAAGVGAALSLASSSTPSGYFESVSPAPEVLDKSTEHVRNGYYVNAVELVGASVDRVANAIEGTRRTVVVYEVP